MIAVSTLHSLYVERSGTPGGYPIFFLHGGPGSHTRAIHRRYFDPLFFEIVLFDQRGCGRSVPAGETQENTTSLLADDIHAIREALGITRNISILGGSWGSTLALAYALRYPQSLDELILRGVFLGTQAEVDWYTQGLSRFVPEAWAQFACAGAADLLEHYYYAVNDADDKRAAEAAVRWANYEMQIMATMPIGAGGAASQSLTQTSMPSGSYVQDTLHSTRVHLHYLSHQCFLAGNPLLDAAHTIEMPVTIVQGRMDLVCPPNTAWQLSQRLPFARLRMVDKAGHSATSGSLALALREEVDALRDRLVSQSAGGKR